MDDIQHLTAEAIAKHVRKEELTSEEALALDRWFAQAVDHRDLLDGLRNGPPLNIDLRSYLLPVVDKTWEKLASRLKEREIPAEESEAHVQENGVNGAKREITEEKY